MENKKNTILIVLVCIVILLVVVVSVKFGMSKKDKEEGGEETTTYEVLHINQLSERLSMISFNHQDYYEIAEADVTLLARVEDEHVSVTYTFDENTTRNYVVKSITGILSIGCGISADSSIARTFFLTKTGKVYMLEDNLASVKANEAYEGKPVDMGFDNASEIFVANGNFMLNDKPYSEPAVYIKTSDGHLYTNEKMLIDREQKGFVELK